MKKPGGQPDGVNRRRPINTMKEKKRGQTMTYKTLHKKPGFYGYLNDFI